MATTATQSRSESMASSFAPVRPQTTGLRHGRHRGAGQATLSQIFAFHGFQAFLGTPGFPPPRARPSCISPRG